MAVVHTNGIHSVKIDYCGCNTHAVSHRQQLLRFKLFPATVRKPRTCVTFVALETLHLQNVQSKCGVYDLYTSLERITDNTGLGTSRVCYFISSSSLSFDSTVLLAMLSLRTSLFTPVEISQNAKARWERPCPRWYPINSTGAAGCGLPGMSPPWHQCTKRSKYSARER